ncbi:MAG: methionyl-tRNA formyltransferase [Gemmatimonadota bacterium]
MRIVFFGTPAFAVPSLKALLAAGFDVSAVVTQPDKPQGRSRSQLVPAPIKVIAADLDIPVLQPVKPVGDVFAETLRRFDPDLGVVVAYGHILRPDVLAIPRTGMINVHASLLPKLRGAAPIQWAILHGETETGVSIMRMEEGVDSGPVYHRVATPIGYEETGGELSHRLAQIGGAALIETITAQMKDNEPPIPQDHGMATFAPKIDRELCRMKWEEDAGQCVRRLRAFDPDPGAWTTFNGTEVKLFGGRIQDSVDHSSIQGCLPGTVLQAGERLSILSGRGGLMVREVQPAGKKRMAVADWVRGRGISAGQRFE